MLDRLPDTLFRTKRGLCPCCGSPLPLGQDTSHIECGYCGQRAVLERRLRRAEPEVPGAPLRQFESHDHEGWTRTDRLAEAYLREASCPGCGQGLDEPAHGSRVACGSCGMECHLERRLVPPAEHPLRSVPRARHPEEQRVYDLRDDEDPKTEHLIYRLAHESDADRAMGLSLYLGRWTLINPTLARLMPALLERLARGDAALAHQIADAVGKCLCSDVGIARETVRALEPWIVRVPAERQLLSALGLGKAIGLKLLLDSAAMAYKAGDLEQSVAALFGINWMLQRNYPEHPIISQILLHRMFYLSGPPLAFCVMFMHGQVSDVAFRYDPRTTLAYLDDAVAERPCLVPSLDHERAFWCGPATDEQEWAERHAFVESLRIDEAKIAAWRWYLDPPEGAGAEFYEEYGRKARALMDRQDPAWRVIGEQRVERIIRGIKPCPASIMSLAAERGESLAGEVRRAFLGEYPRCGLDFQNLPNWESEPKPQEHPEVAEARRLYKQGLDLHLGRKSNDRGAWKAYWDARGGTPRELPDIFDGQSQGPAPPARSGAKRPYPRPWEEAQDAGRPAPGEETAPPDGTDEADAVVETDPAEREPEGADGLPGDRGDFGASGRGGGPGEIPTDHTVTIWEYVASLPPEQQRQYEGVLQQLEPQRKAIEAAMRAARGEPAQPEATPAARRGLLGRLFGRPKG